MGFPRRLGREAPPRVRQPIKAGQGPTASGRRGPSPSEGGRRERMRGRAAAAPPVLAATMVAAYPGVGAGTARKSHGWLTVWSPGRPPPAKPAKAGRRGCVLPRRPPLDGRSTPPYGERAVCRGPGRRGRHRLPRLRGPGKWSTRTTGGRRPCCVLFKTTTTLRCRPPVVRISTWQALCRADAGPSIRSSADGDRRLVDVALIRQPIPATGAGG